MTTERPRPAPEELLARMKAEAAPANKGKLKVFLGYAAGVGKTYTMLEAARQERDEIDLVVAYVETHGRPETEALLAGLEVIPTKRVRYHGVTLPEMDLDAVLKRHPRLALVDELAHTNAPDSRHPKRYQDVEELLEAGIDVYTTLNIQHIESLRDIVAQVTNVWMRETVPDSVVDNAAEIEIVDLPPDELLKRLKEGKVYVPEQVAHATTRFFRKGNLTALRELTMRTAAQHVDRQAQAYMEAHAIRGPWPSGERLLVGISESPVAPRLVRSARRLAYQLGAEWFAINVETPAARKLSPDEEDRLMSAMRLAEQMGATRATVQGDSVASALAQFATSHNVTRIVLGKPRHRLWPNPLRGSIVDQVIDRNPLIDVYVVGREAEPAPARPRPAEEGRRNRGGYVQGAGLVMLATLVGALGRGFFAESNMLMGYLLCVAVVAVFWGFGPSIMVSVLSVIAFVFVLKPPVSGLDLRDTQYIFTLITLLGVGVLISYLTSRVRAQTEAARRREQETAALYALSRDLTVSNDLDAYVRAILKRARETFGRDAVIFLPDRNDRTKLKPYSDKGNISIAESDLAAAQWCFQHQHIIGSGTDTLPGARWRYLPLITARGAVGVMAIAMDPGHKLSMAEERLVAAYADLDALAIEGTLLTEEAHNARMLRETENLHTALLSLISLDLRAPLVNIIDMLNSLSEPGACEGPTARDTLRAASVEAERLNHLITHLVDQSRIDAGLVSISRQPASVPDLISAALDRLGDSLERSRVSVNLPPGLPPVPVDFALMTQTMVNIFDNCFKYSAPDTPVEISARLVDDKLQIEAADRGIGIPRDDLVRVFDKFYRVQRPDNVAGTGLGLSISKGFVEAHGGRIWAENRPGGGTIVKLQLPLDSQKKL